MRCPYCGAEVVGRRCIFCTSDLIDYIKKNGLEIDDFTEKEQTKAKNSDKDTETDAEKQEKSQEEIFAEIRKVCAKFQKVSDPDEFASYDKNRKLTSGKSVKARMFETLDIPDGEEIFLIHDDTMLHTGKNGFAITESGFYCKVVFEDLVFTGFDELEEHDQVKKGDNTVALQEDNRALMYYTGDSKVQDSLQRLGDDILKILF